MRDSLRSYCRTNVLTTHYLLHPDINITSPVRRGAVVWQTPLCHTRKCSLVAAASCRRYKRTLQYRHYTETSRNIRSFYMNVKFYMTLQVLLQIQARFWPFLNNNGQYYNS